MTASIHDFYEIDLDRICSQLRDKEASRVLLELPDGLKHFSAQLAREIAEKCGCQVYIRAGHVYGACDMGYREAELVGATHIIHLGHTEYPRSLYTHVSGARVKVIYEPVKSRLTISQAMVGRTIDLLKIRNVKRVGLLATVQHAHLLVGLAHMLEEGGVKPIIGRPAFPESVPGQVLGCEYSAALGLADRVDGFVIVSGGAFHSIGVVLATGKPTIQLDPYRRDAVDMTAEAYRVLRQRYGVILKAMDAEGWAIILGSKSGQLRLSLVKQLERLIEGRGHRYYRFVVDQLDTDVLRNIDSTEIDAFIVTSCPRLPIDDLYAYHKPVLTPGEARMVLTDSLDKYLFPW